ncbi:MAG: hypothetical protein J5865_03320 [Lachnospiraceae bacterium]|nr:hypothetical protein [Lachnospiraceae bacterium]
MKTMEQWAKQAASYIRAADEREAAIEELHAHFEDHRDALMERGLSQKDAEAEALRAMGDPDETGQLLKQTHSPWPSWALRASRWLLAAAILLFINYMILAGFSPVQRFYYTSNLKKTLAEFDAEDSYWDKRELSCDAKIRAGEYRVSVYRAQAVMPKEDPGYVSSYLQVILCAKGPIELGAPDVLVHYMEARDSSGTELINLFEKQDDDQTPLILTGEVIGRKWNRHYMVLTYSHYDRDAEWVDLTYDHNGVQFSIRIDLKGGGA